MDFIEEVSKHVDIEEGRNVIEQILIQIYLKEKSSNKELGQITLLPIPMITAIKKEFIKLGILEQKFGIVMTTKGKEYVEDKLGYKGVKKAFLNKIMDNKNDFYNELSETLDKISMILDGRPKANITIDQTQCKPETSLNRAILCLQHNALIGKNILCVGDDDLVSISLGFLLKSLYNDSTLIKTKIHVLDIDERYLEYIESIAKAYNLPISCSHVDFRNPINEELNNKFDVFFTDPPYTINGMKLFLSRGVSALKKEVGLPIFFSFSHKTPNFLLQMMKVYTEMGLAMSEVRPRFNEYNGAGIINNTSQLIILRTTSETQAIVKGVYNDPLYTGELKKTIRVYECKNCGYKNEVGFDRELKTIEELKDKGCQECGENLFDIVDKFNA